MFKLPPRNELVAGYLARGQRIEAAYSARNAAENASAEELRELVKILADHIGALGNVRTRGRPRAGDLTPAGQQAWAKAVMLKQASRQLRALLICRDLVDGQPVGPLSLSLLLFALGRNLEDDPVDMPADELIRHRAERLAADPALKTQLVDALKPLAETELKDWQLQPARVTRHGFRAVYRRKVSAAYRRHRITERDLEDVAHETSE